MKRKQLAYKNTYCFQHATLSFQVLGKGKPVVLLHGTLTNWTGQDFCQQLAKHYQVFIPDLPGFGASDTIPGQKHNLNLFSQAFAAFLKTNKLQNAPVIALSLGAMVAVKTAALGYHKGKLILVGLPGKVEFKNNLLTKMPLAWQKFLISTKFGQKYFLLPLTRKQTGGREKKELILKALSHTDPGAILDIDYQKEIETDLPQNLAKIKNQVVFIYGEKDPLQNITKHLIKKYLTVPGAGHNIFTTNPNQALKIILSILKPGFPA